MATGIGVLDLTFNAGADLSASIYCAVKKETEGNEVVLAGEGDAVLGILQNKPKEDQAATVRVYGTSPMITGTDGVTEGALVASDGSGQAQTAESTQYILGICTDAGNFATGKIATVLLLPQGKL